ESFVVLFHMTPQSGYLLALLFFFLNITATTEIYTLSLHDALPILDPGQRLPIVGRLLEMPEHAKESLLRGILRRRVVAQHPPARSEEHTSELQSRGHLVCRLLLEKKKDSTRHC